MLISTIGCEILRTDHGFFSKFKQSVVRIGNHHVHKHSLLRFHRGSFGSAVGSYKPKTTSPLAGGNGYDAIFTTVDQEHITKRQ